MDIPYRLLVSVIVAVTNVIPFFGPYIGAVPSAVLILTVSPFQCLVFIVFIILLQQFDGNFLGPRILSTSTGLTGFWIIFSITLFGGLWGLKRSANISQAFLNALTSPPPPPKPTGPGCSLFAAASQNIILAVGLDKHMLRFINSQMHQEISICPCR